MTRLSFAVAWPCFLLWPYVEAYMNPYSSPSARTGIRSTPSSTIHRGAIHESATPTSAPVHAEVRRDEDPVTIQTSIATTMEGCDFYGCSPQVIVAAVNEVNDDGVVVDIPLDPDGNAAAANAAKTSEDEARINGALVTATMQAQQAVSTSLQLQAQQAASISLQAQQAASISLQAQAAQQVMSASLRAQQAQAAISNSIASAPAAAVTAPNTTAPISLTPPGPALPLNTVSASIESWQNQGEANCANWFDDDLQTATVAPAPAEVAEEIACIAYLESLDAQLAGELEANKKRRNRGRGVGRPSDNVDAWPTSKPYV